MSTFLFPGQGSQHTGMGTELFQRFPDFVQQANAILGYAIEELCANNPEQKLNQTQYTQPALYTVNALSYFDKCQQGHKPNYVAGHSLGEYNALLAAEVFDFETGLKLVQRRGQLMQQATGGAMLAVVGLAPEAIETTLQNPEFNSIDVANVNAPNQTVVSGPQDDITTLKPVLEQAGAMMVIPLKVSGAFHSRYMREAQIEFQQFLASFTFQAPKIPVIANVTAQPYTQDNVAQLLSEQLTHSVRWTESIQYLIQQNETEFEEVGPGNVLKGLMRHIKAATA